MTGKQKIETLKEALSGLLGEFEAHHPEYNFHKNKAKQALERSK